MKRVLVSVLLCISWIGVAQKPQSEISVGNTYVIHSKTLDEKRILGIHLPEGYKNTNDQFPVLYVLDGEWNFQFTSSLVDKLSAAGELPKMIVVGIYNTNRNRDLTPPEEHSNPALFGGGKRFLDYITKEVQPWVVQNYRTESFSILAGHSFGGLFAAYAMTEASDAFSAFIVLSPSLGRNNEKQIERTVQFLKESAQFPKSLYLAIANERGGTHLSTKKWVALLKEHANQDFSFVFEHLEEETHASISAQGMINGLKFIFEGFNPERLPLLDEVFLFEQHFEELSKKLGYPIPVPEEYYQSFFKEQIAENELDYALFILQNYEKQYPQSPYVVYGYAQYHALNGEFEKALSFYKQVKPLGFELKMLDSILESRK